MIVGSVTVDGEARVTMAFRGPSGPELRVAAVVDTGYTEHAALPPDLIGALVLPFQHDADLVLANGDVASVRVFEGVRVWDCQDVTVPIQELSGDALVGMALRKGHNASMDVQDGGQVTIQRLP